MIKADMTISSIIEHYPETRAVFIANGLDDLVDKDKLKTVGAFLTLESALKIKEKDLSLAGKFAAAQEGTDWVDKAYGQIENPQMLPDICLSAGFDFFFAKPFIDRFIRSGVFKKALPWTENKDFQGLGLQDPKNHYNIISIVPAVFVVDKAALEKRPIPRTWEDLLKKQYENLIAMPDRCLDIPRSILLTLYARFGEKGIQSLGRNTKSQLHPAQMVKQIKSTAKDRSAISIMPYFFSKTVDEAEGISVIWPEDGAIISPIYMLVKSESEFCQADPRIVENVVDFFSGPQMGKIFTNGYFPSLHPKVDNALPTDASFQWIGWEFLKKMDSGVMLPRVYKIFDKETALTKEHEKMKTGTRKK